MQSPLPQPLLGNSWAFTINTTDLDRSLSFYTALGFRELMRTEMPFPFSLISDDAILIMLRLSDPPYIAMTYYTADAASVAGMLENKGLAFVSKPKSSDFVQRYLLQSPDGTNVSIVQSPMQFEKPAGKTMLQMSPDDYMKPDRYTNKKAGMFGEFAQKVTSLDASIAFWEKLGFAVLSRYTKPAAWAILSDGLAIVGLHEQGDFDKPAITFFAADMRQKLEALRNSGLSFTESSPGNTILATPEGQSLFLYSMGM